MRLGLTLLVLVASSTVQAASCDMLHDSGDGIPAEYYIHECKGNQALASGDATLAAKHFRKALAVHKFEAPNYELKVELAEALCMQGRVVEAQYQITEFQCQADVDLGEIKCPIEHSASKACTSICDEFGSALSATGRDALLARKARAAKVLANCGRPTPLLQRKTNGSADLKR